MKLVVALGNPGKKYSGTRHNIGFDLLEKYLSLQGLILKSENKFDADMVSDDTHLGKVIYALPTTFMNNSGQAVAKIANFYKVALEDILVVHDDVSLDIGKIRFCFDRGAGGQHGVEDIIARLGNSKKFYRLRIGVGPDPGGDMRGDFVLSKFTNKEKTVLEPVFEQSCQFIADWLAGNAEITTVSVG